MVKLNKAQRKAVHSVWMRGELVKSNPVPLRRECIQRDIQSYRDFRREVQPGYDCIMVHWCGMWLGIEPDGYTHS
jgi:hypothetical protein